VIGQPTPTTGALRVIRGVSLAVTSAALAVAAHAVAGGGLPDPALTALLTVGLAALGIALADRRRGIGAVLLVLGAAQLATHVLLSIAEQNMAGGQMSGGQMDTPLMTGTHAVAVLVTAVLLATADAVMFRLAAVFSMLLPTVLVAPPVPAGPVTLTPAATPPHRPMSALLTLASPRRGPPRTV
jgi:hypothetical protein